MQRAPISEAAKHLIGFSQLARVGTGFSRSGAGIQIGLPPNQMSGEVMSKSGPDFHSEIEQRVAREKSAHDENDVLTNAKRLKDIFFHVRHTPGFYRMDAIREKYIRTLYDKIVLDYGCGQGEMALRYLHAGAKKVYGIDISERYIRAAIDRMRSAGVNEDSYEFCVMDAHNLKFDNEYFDSVIGNGILHHLDIPVAINEIKRVLKNTGFAMFQEPLIGTPLMRLFRILTPSARTPDERPLSESDLKLLESMFDIAESYCFGAVTAPVAAFTSLILRPFPHNVLVKFFDKLERKWLTSKDMRHFHQYVVLIMRKKSI